MKPALDRGISDDQNDQIFGSSSFHRIDIFRNFASHGGANP